MKTTEKILAVAAGGVVLAGTALALAQLSSAGKYYLQLLAGEGGTTDPSPSPSGRLYSPDEVVTITAKANPDYTVGVWLLDGTEIGNQPQIQVTMNMNHSVVVTFWKGGVPPPAAPYAITTPNTVTVFGYYGCRVEGSSYPLIGAIRVHNCDANWNWDAIAEYQMTFKVVDSSGKGVPNVPVLLNTDLFPDNGKYSGFLVMDDAMSRPITKITDANGNVTVNLSYWYGLNDQKEALCADAGLYIYVGHYILVPIPWGIAVKDYGDYNPIPPQILIYYGGDDYSGSGKNNNNRNMGNVVVNYVSAQLPNSPTVQKTLGIVQCGFHVKMLPAI